MLTPMTTINDPSGTTIDEVGGGLYRITTPVRASGFAFTFNRYLLVDDEAVLFNTGPRKMASLVIAAVAKVLPLAKVRWISFGHVEADECGALNEILAAAPSAVPLCGSLAARVSMNDLADRAPRELEDGEEIVTGRRRLSWIAAPHVPHAWENGFLFDTTTKTRRLLRPWAEYTGADRAPRGPRADDPRVHARKCVARRWREVVAGFGRARRGVNARVAVPPGATKSRGVCSDYQTCGISR